MRFNKIWYCGLLLWGGLLWVACQTPPAAETIVQTVEVTRVVTQEVEIPVEIAVEVEVTSMPITPEPRQVEEVPSFVYGDARPDAPELAPRGPYRLGVRTLELVNPEQIDIVNVTSADPNPRYDRPLTVEVWYPAVLPPDTVEGTIYRDVLGFGPDNPERPNLPFEFAGRAVRGAEPDTAEGPYPLIIVSHGFPGSRLFLANLTENLATKGYVVVAIDHTDSTFDNVGPFQSTLVNRALDDLFVLEQMAQLNAGEGFLAGLVDAENTAIIGYSMGGYGALNAAGAGYSQAVAPFVPEGHLLPRTMGHEDYRASQDERLKVIVALAPWGGEAALAAGGLPGLSVWDAEGMAGLELPTLFIVGDHDDVSGYEGGVKTLFEQAVNSDRYLLVYQNALHNVAPNPPPPLTQMAGFTEFERFSEPAWDRTRMNNINQHFITAFLGIHLKGEAHEAYLDLIPFSNDGVWDMDDEGNPTEAHTYWAGFQNRTAIGLELYHLAPE